MRRRKFLAQHFVAFCHGHASSFYGAAVLEHTLSEEEHSQIVQTIEMFEVITQTQPDDYQSLEILKDAYLKINKPAESLRISRKLAEAHFNGGSYTLAMQECELILVKEPNAPEILAMLGEIEARLQAAGQSGAGGGAENGLIFSSKLTGGEGVGSGLVDLQSRRTDVNPQDRGDDQLAKFLVMQQLVPADTATQALETVNHLNKDLSGQALALVAARQDLPAGHGQT